jgi:hypothetical protein
VIDKKLYQLKRIKIRECFSNIFTKMGDTMKRMGAGITFRSENVLSVDF